MDTKIITYIPGSAVKKLPPGSVVVSIKGRYETRPEIDKSHIVHHLDFDVPFGPDDKRGVSEDQVVDVVRFVLQHQDKDIYVHCTEGRCRSKTVVMCVGKVTTHRPRSCEHSTQGGWIDRNTANVITDAIDKHREEFEPD